MAYSSSSGVGNKGSNSQQLIGSGGSGASRPGGSSTNASVKKPPYQSTSWSYTDNEPDIKYDHAWSIANFSRKMDMENGEELKSGVFTIQTKDRQTDWFMRINPNGEEKTCKGFVSLFLYKDGYCEVSINADIIFSIIDKDGNKMRPKRCEYVFEKNLPSDNRGFAKFVAHHELKSPPLNLLPNDTLTILCEITITGENFVTSGSNKPSVLRPGSLAKTTANQSNSLLAQSLYSLLSTGKFSDCIVACDDRQFYCHKNILSARSTVFDAMFTHDMEENRNSKVNILDLDSETVGDMITYIYSGKVNDLHMKADRLLSAAEKYDLRELKTMCEEALCTVMSTENVLDLLVLADLHGATILRGQALTFIVDSGKDIVSQAGWKEKLKAYPLIIADMFEAMARIPNKRQKFN